MKTVATFTVHGTLEQSRRWTVAAEAEGHGSVGVWLARAADAYLRSSTGPARLVWYRQRFRVFYEGIEGERMVKGQAAPPFGLYRGSPQGPSMRGCQDYTLIHVPTGRVIATMQHARDAKALACELAGLWARWDGCEPLEATASTLQHPTSRQRRGELPHT